MSEITTADQEDIIAETEHLIDRLIPLYHELVAQDAASGVDSDWPALGGLGMVLQELGYYNMPHNLMMLAILAVRRIAKAGQSNG